MTDSTRSDSPALPGRATVNPAWWYWYETHDLRLSAGLVTHQGAPPTTTRLSDMQEREGERA